MRLTTAVIVCLTLAGNHITLAQPTEPVPPKKTNPTAKTPTTTTTTTTKTTTREATEEEKKAAAAATAAAGGVFLGMSLLSVVCIGAFALIMSLLPGLIAAMRGHPNTAPIFLVAIFLGWTGIGWIIALIWAFTAIDQPRRHRD